MLDPILDGRLDLGRRDGARGAFPWQLRVANRALVGRIRRRRQLPLPRFVTRGRPPGLPSRLDTGVRIADLGRMRAVPRTALLGLGLQDRRSGYLVRRGRPNVIGAPLGVWQAVRNMSAAIAG